MSDSNRNWESQIPYDKPFSTHSPITPKTKNPTLVELGVMPLRILFSFSLCHFHLKQHTQLYHLDGYNHTHQWLYNPLPPRAPQGTTDACRLRYRLLICCWTSSFYFWAFAFFFVLNIQEKYFPAFICECKTTTGFSNKQILFLINSNYACNLLIISWKILS